MNREEVAAGVCAIIARKTGLQSARLTDEVRLFEDLGVDGDDAEELLLAISEAYPIDFSRFRFSRHFAAEPTLLRLFSQRPKTEPLTVSALIAAAMSGSLVSDP